MARTIRTVGWVERSETHVGLAPLLVGLAALDPPYTADPPDAPDPPDASTQVSGPRDLLQRYGVDPGQLARLTDGHAIDEKERETLLRIMYWLHRFRPEDIEAWAQNEPRLAELAADSSACRGEIFRLSGLVTSLDVCRPSPEMANRLELDQYYRCEFLLDDQQPAIVYAPSVPKQWPQNQSLHERAGAFGLFLKLAGSDADRPLPVFVTRRIAWYPNILLGNLGMDVGLLDNVVDRTGLARSRRKGLLYVEPEEIRRAADEREAFYAMLEAVGRAKPGQLLREADRVLRQADKEAIRTDEDGRKHYSVVPLFNRPKQQRGRLVALSATARRVVRIRVDDPDIVSRFGIDHYYEMEVFTDDSQDNPVVFCVRKLPKGMPVGDGPQYAEEVRVTGCFFKSWAYRAERPAEMPEAGRGRGAPRQLAPLLIGREPVWYPPESPRTSTPVGAIAAGLFVLVLVGVWLTLWRYARADKRFHDRTMAKTLAPDSGILLDEIGLSADGSPDFSRLEGLEDSDGPIEKDATKEDE